MVLSSARSSLWDEGVFVLSSNSCETLVIKKNKFESVSPCDECTAFACIQPMLSFKGPGSTVFFGC